MTTPATSSPDFICVPGAILAKQRATHFALAADLFRKLESLLAGARLGSKTDDAFLREAQKGFDYLYAAFSDEVSKRTPAPASETRRRERTRR